MNYSLVRDCDIADGPGVRVSLFVSGCTHHCKGCFQPETWDFNHGQPFTNVTADHILQLLDRPYIRGLTLLGGEPFELAHRDVMVNFLQRVRAELPKKTIWAYSGYTLEELMKMEELTPMLKYIDVLVDGEFVEELHDISLRFRGSSNQRIINLQKTLTSNKLVLWED